MSEHGHEQELGSEDDPWAVFVRRHWERAPALLAADDSALLPHIPPVALFRAVVACTDDFARGAERAVRLYVDGADIDVIGGEHQALLPQLGDQSFEGYARRMAGHGFADYAVIVADWHAFDRSLWERLVESVAGLAAQVGISAVRMDTQVFLGTYRVTPFGVHADPTASFHCPVVGKKTMRFWASSFAEQEPALQEAHAYAAFLERSVALTARPGEVLFWPSSAWHVGESDGSFSVTWGLGYWFGDGTRTPTAEALARRSAYGFRQVPAPALLEEEPVRLAPGRRLRRKGIFPIVSSDIEPGRLCVAVAGHVRILPASRALSAAVDQLNRLETVTCDELCRTPGDRALIEPLLDLCLASGAATLDASTLQEAPCRAP